MPGPRDALALLPYPPRPHQADLVRHLSRPLLHGRHAVAESGTGTGKTVSALAAALHAAHARGLRVLYLTRTNSQNQQVMREFRAIRQHAPDAVAGGAVALQGRHHLCPLRREDPELAEADAEELAVACRDRMKAAEASHAGGEPRASPCGYHLRGLQDGSDDLLAWARDAAPEAEELSARVVAAGQCPYVLTRRLVAGATLVVAPYVWFFSPPLRRALLQWMGAAMEDLLVVVDEAHNVADYARGLATASLGRATLERARREAREFGDPEVLPSARLTGLLGALEDALDEARAQYLPASEEDALLPPDEVDVLLLTALRTSTPMLDRAIVLLEEYGAAVREARRRRGKLARSHVGRVGTFLRAWRTLEHETHARLVELEDGQPRLTAFAVDPTPVTEALLETAGSVHLSGTLAPLEEYRDTLGLPRDAALATFPSPFPRENRLVLVDDEVTTRHEDLARDPQLWDLMRARLRALRAATRRNLAVFAPSHEALRRVAPALEGPGAFVERAGLPQDALMRGVEAFRGARGGTLASVIGGRVSEGLDFPSEQLEVVAVVGLPYPKPTAKQEALVRFHERRSGRGWEYGVKVPMVRRVLQAAGRLIRTPTDRGVVVLFDRRAAMLRGALPELRVTSDPAREVRAFFDAPPRAAPQATGDFAPARLPADLGGAQRPEGGDQRAGRTRARTASRTGGRATSEERAGVREPGAGRAGAVRRGGSRGA